MHPIPLRRQRVYSECSSNINAKIEQESEARPKSIKAEKFLIQARLERKEDTRTSSPYKEQDKEEKHCILSLTHPPSRYIRDRKCEKKEQQGTPHYPLAPFPCMQSRNPLFSILLSTQNP